MAMRSLGLLAVVGAISAGAAPWGAAQTVCEVRGERSYTVLEQRPVQWGGEVDIVLDLHLDCGAAAVRSLGVTEALPPAMRLQPGFGTPPDAEPDGGLSWLLLDPPQHVTLAYRVIAMPQPDAFDANGRTEVSWPMRLEVAVAGRVEQPEPPPVDPLTVARRPGARGCELAASWDVEPQEVDTGEPFSATLNLRFDRCRFPGPRLRAVVALQPYPDPAPAAALATAAAALATRIAGHQPGQAGMVGVVANARQAPVAMAPSVDLDRAVARLDELALGPGADAAAALAAALAVLESWPFHHQVVFYLTHRDAPRAGQGALQQLLGEANARGVDVVTVCVGGSCDPELQDVVALPEWPALRHRAERLVAEHLGPESEVGPISVSGDLPIHLDVLSVSPEPLPMTGEGRFDWRGLWTMPGAPLQVGFRARAARWGRFPVGASMTVAYQAADGRSGDSALLLPGFVTVRSPAHEGQACSATVDKLARPERLALGDPTTVELAVRPECLELDDGLHVVLSLDRSGSMGFGVEYQYVKLAARALGEMLDVRPGAGRRFGLVEHGDPASVAVPLTDDPDEIGSRIDGMLARGQDNLAGSLELATALLVAGRPGGGPPPREMLVVLSDGGQTYGPETALPAAAAAAAEGIRVVSVCAQTHSSDCETMARLAGGPSDVFQVDRIDLLLESLVGIALQLRQVAISETVVVDDLAPNVRLVPGSLVPAPERIDGGRLVWRWADPSPFGVVARYQVQPLLLGRQPTNVWAEASFTDARGRSGRRALPVPHVETTDVEPTGPCTALLETLTSAERLAIGEPVTVTLRGSLACSPRPALLDVVLVIDHSASMGTFDRLRHAKSATHAFLDALDPEYARVGLVGFAGQVTERVPLTADYGAVRRSVDRLQPLGQTALAPALRAAHDLLAERRPDAQAAIVLLTDGRLSGSFEPVLAAAAAARAADILLATFCAGTCDPELQSIASRPDLAVTVADSAQLAALYARLASELAMSVVRDLRVRQILPDGLAALPDAAHPPPQIGPHEGLTEWHLAGDATGGVTVTAAMVPLRDGDMPLGQAWLDYRYGHGPSWRARFPQRAVRVLAAVPATALPMVSPTPTSGPAATATGATVVAPLTATPTFSPSWARRVFLPTAARGRAQTDSATASSNATTCTSATGSHNSSPARNSASPITTRPFR